MVLYGVKCVSHVSYVMQLLICDKKCRMKISSCVCSFLELHNVDCGP